MKTSQLIVAVAALMVMIFAITFAINTLPESGGGGVGKKKNVETTESKKDLPQIVFETTTYPPYKGSVREWEAKKEGRADFWFGNPNATDVKIGLVSKNCKCQSLEMFLAKPEWKEWRERNAKVSAAGPAVGSLTRMYLEKQEADMHRRESELARVVLDEKDEGHSVPAGSVGWVRMNWTGDKIGAQKLSAEIWMHGKLSSLTQKLESSLVFFPIYRTVRPYESVGTLTPRELPKNLSIICVSSVRDSLDLKAEKVANAGLEKADPFVVGPPVRLTRTECEELQQKYDEGPVMCAYRVAVTLMDRVGDRLFETGPIRRHVKLFLGGKEDIEPILVPVLGSVEGEVHVGAAEDNGRLILGTFDRATGSQSHAINLTTEVEGLKLELDATRKPEFLDVEFEEKKTTLGGRRVWQLQARVPPGKVSGIFPRDDSPLYRDSAIYVKSIGAVTRLIRIPVEGKADIR